MEDDVYIYLKMLNFSDKEINYLYEKNIYLTRVLDVDVEKRVDYFKSLGITNEELKSIVLKEPNILVYSLNRIKGVQNEYKEKGIEGDKYKELLLEDIKILSL